MLLFEDYTTALLADPTIAYADSCAFDDRSFMAWTEKQIIGDFWFDIREGGSLRTQVLGRAQIGYRTLRELAKNYSAPMRRALRH